MSFESGDDLARALHGFDFSTVSTDTSPAVSSVDVIRKKRDELNVLLSKWGEARTMVDREVAMLAADDKEKGLPGRESPSPPPEQFVEDRPSRMASIKIRSHSSGDLKQVLLTDAREELRRMFDKFDIDGNNEIDTFELQELMRENGIELSDADVASAMADLDKDDSGSLDFEEFYRVMMPLLKAANSCLPPPPRLDHGALVLHLQAAGATCTAANVTPRRRSRGARSATAAADVQRCLGHGKFNVWPCIRVSISCTAP